MKKFVMKYTLDGKKYAQLVEAYTFGKAFRLANAFIKMFEGAELVEVRQCLIR